MKRALTLILPLVLFACWAVLSADPSVAQSASESQTFLNTIIDPGLAVGSLKIGDSREHALALFPKKPEDQEWDDACGSTIDWVDTSNPNGRGDLFIRMKKGKVFQIESSTSRFHTAEGITTFDSPAKVAQSYKDLRAWVLLTPPVPALGDRPLIFWGDKKRGIAFVLAYDPPHQKRYVYKVMVFVPGHDFCPELEKPNSSKWQVIAPYSLEPPIELEPQ